MAVFSDGLQMLALKMPGGTPHAPFFAPLFRFINNAADEPQIHSELESFLRSPTVRRRADDDLTLFLQRRTADRAGDGPLTLTDDGPTENR